MTENQHGGARFDPGRSILLDPRFLIQIATIIVTVAAFALNVNAKVASLSDKQIELSSAVSEVRAALPNREANDLRYKQLEERVARAETQCAVVDTWMRNTRERLAEKGWRP